MLIDGSKYELKVQKVGQHATGTPRVQFAPPEANANSLSLSLFSPSSALSAARTCRNGIKSSCSR